MDESSILQPQPSSETSTPIRDAVAGGAGFDLLVDQRKAEGRVKVETDTKHGELAAGIAVRKWYDGALEYFGFASWRPKRK